MTFLNSPSPPLPSLSVCLSFLKNSGLQHLISSVRATQWFDISIHYWNGLHLKPSYHLSHITKMSTPFSTIFLILYISSLWLIYFVIGSLYLWISLFRPGCKRSRKWTKLCKIRLEKSLENVYSENGINDHLDLGCFQSVAFNSNVY